MNGKTTRRLAAGAAALLAVGGGGGAIAATKAGGKPDQQAILDAAAKRLGVTSDALGGALAGALSDRLDAAVAAGELTQARADALKQRLEAGELPLFGGRHGGLRHLGLRGDLAAAAAYLGTTQAELRTALRGGKTLADVATDGGKSVGGLVDALVADLKQRLDAAVTAKKLTQAQADGLLADARTRITAKVNGQEPAGHPGGFGRGHRGSGPGPTPAAGSLRHGGGRFL